MFTPSNWETHCKMRYRIIGKRGIKTTNLNRRRAIRRHCHMCSDFQWNEVLACRFYDCPLHPFRAGNCKASDRSPEQRRHAIVKFCSGCVGENKCTSMDCGTPHCALFPYRKG